MRRIGLALGCCYAVCEQLTDWLLSSTDNFSFWSSFFSHQLVAHRESRIATRLIYFRSCLRYFLMSQVFFSYSGTHITIKDQESFIFLFLHSLCRKSQTAAAAWAARGWVVTSLTSRAEDPRFVSWRLQQPLALSSDSPLLPYWLLRFSCDSGERHGQNNTMQTLTWRGTWYSYPHGIRPPPPLNGFDLTLEKEKEKNAFPENKKI